MAIDTSALPYPKHTPAPVARHWRATANDAKLEHAYRAVELREDNHCQVTGVPLVPKSPNDKRRREHHHLTGRRVRPEWRHRPERILLVSADVHRLLESHALQPDGCDARKPIRFAWNRRIVPAGKEPFRLRREVAA